MISKTSVQIIKALLELAKLPDGQVEGVVRIAKRIHAPQNYLGKVLQRLVSQGIVTSRKGLKGGFRLAKAPSRILLYDIVNSIEDLQRLDGCLMGKGACSRLSPCLAHDRWAAAKKGYMDFLNNTSIADLMR